MTNTVLVPVSDAQAKFRQFREQPELHLPMAREICRRENIPEDCTRIQGGSQLVISSADRYIIKIFFPEDGDFCRNETIFLEQLHQQLSIHSPKLYASGYHHQYPYIIMEKLLGTPLDKIWNNLSYDGKKSVVSQLGKTIRQLHELPVDRFRDAPFDWHNLIDTQNEKLVENHRNFKLHEKWLCQLEDYMDFPSLDAHNSARIVPLHTEVMHDHIFIDRENDKITVSGLIDFEPSMTGHAEYEFCSVGIFITQGDRDLFRIFLSSYGLPEEQLNRQLSRRVMMFLLLHRYSYLRWFLSLIPDQFQFTSLAQLEAYWFGL